MDAWDAISRFGVPTVGMAAFGYAAYKAVWPFLTKQIEDSQKRLDKQAEGFLDALKRQDQVMQDEFSKLHRTLESTCKAIDVEPRRRRR